MAVKTKSHLKKAFFSRHWHLKHFLIGLCIILLLLVLLLAGVIGWNKWQTDRRQDKLKPFYNTAGLSLEGPLGQVVRSEPLGVSVQHGTAERILYRTQRADSTPTFSSGMLFIPDNTNAGLPRPVVAWAHGTVGMGDQCAPSRAAKPASDIDWVNSMLAKGWVVTATDYAGLGTPGTEGYLVGGDEARDVLNSVRAARNVPATQAGSRFAVWGHSQGGHSALFTGAQAANYAPELQLVGTVASAPAAELVALLSETAGTATDWIIGPEVLTSWPTAYPALNPTAITTADAYKNYQRIAQQCIAQAVLAGVTRTNLKQTFFSEDVTKNQTWRAAAQDQTAPVLPSSQPLLVAESLTDQVILPNTTALYMQRACQAGSNLNSLWLANVDHVQLQNVIAPQVIGWIADRFAGLPNPSTCQRPLPLTPARVPPL